MMIRTLAALLLWRLLAPGDGWPLTAAERTAIDGRTWPVYGPFPDPPYPGGSYGYGSGRYGYGPYGIGEADPA
jgi:hypothetical protein